MNSDTIVAKRYAKALFEVAQAKQAVGQVEEDLRAVVAAVKANPDFEKLLNHPNIDTSRKLDVVKQTFEGKISEAVFNTLQLLIENGRQTLLSTLLNDYVRIAGEATGEARAIVTTSVPLTEEQTKQVTEKFGKLTGKSIRVENVLDKGIIGGMLVRIGDRLYDASVKGQLARLERTLK
ncbi:F0F1 ATP synthase subunit delta [Paenibacillus sp. y28]|uniref:F0F1 ATP synthase subunit delta n=1 Tax=Paenibacillus sp. y28 TaxID=3129110 RepID=UPI003019646C